MQIFLVILITILSQWIGKQKPSIALCNFNDVTLGSSAIFENRNLRKRRINRDTGPDDAVETPGFPSPSYGGFGFIKD
jgi:hypothetical protein